jgi:ADP-ribosylglycohydrolase
MDQAITIKEYYEKVLGGWLGRCIGSQLGAPLELRPFWYIQWKYKALNNYIKKVTGNEVNDDEMYEIVALLTLEQYGIEFTTDQLAQAWQDRLYKLNFTAEKAALNNLRKRNLRPPQTAMQNNPYYDFIGAQMRGEIWGLISPGCPDVAAEYAKKDAMISHSGEGVYGEVFIACLIALSFFTQNAKELIPEVLHRFIPPDSLYYSIVENCLEWYEKYPDWKQARAQLMQSWKKMRKTLQTQATSFKRKLILGIPKIHEIHVLPNAGIVTMGLLYGEGDFEKSTCIAALWGYDTDCNAGNVGAILGVQKGADLIPLKWKEPLRDTFKTYVHGFSEQRISKIAERICRIGTEVIKNKCPEIQLNGDSDYFLKDE